MSYLTMKNNVLNRARQTGTWATARAGDYLNRAQREMWNIAKEWKQLEQDDTATGTIGQANYSLPSGFIRPLYMELRSGSEKWPLIATEPDSVMTSLSSKSGNMRPISYCIRYQQLWFDANLDIAYTIFMTYLTEPSDMSVDADTTPLPEFILEEFAYGFLMRDLGRNKEFENSYTLFKTMLEDYADSDGRNTNQIEGFYDGFDAIQPYWNERSMWGGYNYWRDGG